MPLVTGSFKEAIQANYGSGASADHVKDASFAEVVSRLASIGFEEVSGIVLEED